MCMTMFKYRLSNCSTIFAFVYCQLYIFFVFMFCQGLGWKFFFWEKIHKWRAFCFVPTLPIFKTWLLYENPLFLLNYKLSWSLSAVIVRENDESASFILTAVPTESWPPIHLKTYSIDSGLHLKYWKSQNKFKAKKWNWSICSWGLMNCPLAY